MSPVGFLVLASVFAILWICTFFCVRQRGWLRIVGAAAIQLSLVAFVYVSAFFLNLLAGLIAALFPPLFLTALVVAIVSYPAFAVTLMAVSIVPTALVFALCMLIPKARIWWIAPTFLVAIFSAQAFGELISQRAMCETAARIGLVEFKRNTFWWSLKDSPDEWFQMEVDAIGKRGEDWLGWSYREMDWYVVPKSALGTVMAPVFDCDKWWIRLGTNP